MSETVPEFSDRRFPVCVAERIDPDNVMAVCEWCKAYAEADGGGALLRFAIGVYQIGQALAWGGVPGRDSAAAACIHLIGAAELAGVGMLSYLPRLFSDCQDEYCAERVLRCMTLAQQQHVYIHRCTPGTIRARRIDLPKLGRLTADLVTSCMALITEPERAAAIASEIEKLNRCEWRSTK